MSDIAKSLDNADLERSNASGPNDLFVTDRDKLGDLFLGKTITNMMKNGTTLLTGNNHANPNSIVPFFYFHNSIFLQLCPGCPQVFDPKLIEPFLERGMMAIFLIESFESTTSDFQKLACRYPEYVVGPQSHFKYRFYSLGANLLHKSVSEQDECLGCTLREKFESSIPRLMELGDAGDYVGGLGQLIQETPVPAAEYAMNLYLETLKEPTDNSINELDTTVQMMYYLSSANSFNSIPQLDSKFLNLPSLFLESLRLHHSDDLELNQYLDLTNTFRGKLSPKIIPSKEKLLSKAIQINDEVNKIESSKKRNLMEFLTTFSLDLPMILTRLITQGTYGAEGTYKEMITNFQSKHLSEIESKILSKYYGVSESAIQVWQLRNKLKQPNSKLTFL